jgi:IS30 family transposase
MDLSAVTQDESTAITYSLINRPPRLLDCQTPMEVLVNLLGRAKLGELAAQRVDGQ